MTVVFGFVIVFVLGLVCFYWFLLDSNSSRFMSFRLIVFSSLRALVVRDWCGGK